MVTVAATVGMLFAAGPQASAETVPTAPSDVKIASVTVSTTRVTGIDRATNERRFELQRRRPGGTWAEAQTIVDHRSGQPAATGLSLSFSVPTGSEVWCFRIKVANDAGSANSAEKCTEKPNLKFDGFVSTSPQFPARNQPFTVRWTECNTALSTPTAATGTFTDIVSINDQAGTSAHVPEGSLGPGDCRTRTIDFPGLPDEGLLTLRVTLDHFNVVNERSESDNARAVTI